MNHLSDPETKPPNSLPIPSAGLPPPLSPFRMPPLLWGSTDLTAATRANIPWLWQGYLAPGAMTLLTSVWKAGKTTLTSLLLAKMKTGGRLAGLPVAPAKVIVVSEESPDHWRRRDQCLAFGDHVGWFCRPFQGAPRPDGWRSFVDGLAELRHSHDVSLVVIDPLAAFFPGRNENNASSMLAALMPLQRLTSTGMSVLMLHHPSKDDPAPGHAARGSGALSGYADILIEMRAFRHAPEGDRRRRLLAFSRFPETTRALAMELTADGADYLPVEFVEQADFATNWPLLRALLAGASRKLTRSDILQSWPGSPIPNKVMLHRWLAYAGNQALVRRDGQGERNHPFRYWLPEREEQWRQDPLDRLIILGEFAPPPTFPP